MTFARLMFPVLIFITSFLIQLPSYPSITYQHSTVQIDGDLSEWDLTKAETFFSLTEDGDIIDTAIVALTWDESFLYVAFRSSDKNLIKEEHGNQNEYIWRNDGLEIYIDSKNDSDSSMDMNDYNLIIDLLGDHTIYTVTKERIENPIIEVPKSNQGVEYYMESKTRLLGTLNDTTDTDQGYIIEVKIPWAPMGLLPQSGDTVKVDICTNNLNQFSKPSDWRTYIRAPERFNATNWLGYCEFGHPYLWKKMVLTGSMSPVKKWMIHSHKRILTIGLCTILMLAMITFYYRRDRQELTELVQRSKIVNRQLLDQIQSMNTNPTPFVHDDKADKEGQKLTLLELQKVVESNLSSISKPSDLARKMNMSLRQLQRICQDELSITPGAYITTIKMERAGQEILKGRKSIKTIAYDLGYTDPNYFSKVFKKYFDKSPSKYQDDNADRI